LEIHAEFSETKKSVEYCPERQNLQENFRNTRWLFSAENKHIFSSDIICHKFVPLETSFLYVWSYVHFCSCTTVLRKFYFLANLENYNDKAHQYSLACHCDLVFALVIYHIISYMLNVIKYFVNKFVLFRFSSWVNLVVWNYFF
jgi:hypothetical protein